MSWYLKNGEVEMELLEVFCQIPRDLIISMLAKKWQKENLRG